VIAIIFFVITALECVMHSSSHVFSREQKQHDGRCKADMSYMMIAPNPLVQRHGTSLTYNMTINGDSTS
jgi:hypothetical protein